MHKSSFFSSSAQDTLRIGQEIGALCKHGDVFFLHGDLGAGKTTLVKGLAHALCQVSPEEVTSPTFTYMHIYQGPLPLYHFDLYRLSSEDEFFHAGFQEHLGGSGVCCIEWPERLPTSLSLTPYILSMHYISSTERTITLLSP
ncbi:MAG: tRNA (adenosine(37)-N6)-threonylcarbamoyltransferase complex ATPase subunit type 1 TsaE [Chlamydiae bacterium]|nr:tRNA (adenosine(37)-N6)-threonylcarbamoyltransferase complex ATPase subunit type 1 TsaE [Chlamydiota bacterium]